MDGGGRWLDEVRFAYVVKSSSGSARCYESRAGPSVQLRLVEKKELVEAGQQGKNREDRVAGCVREDARAPELFRPLLLCVHGCREQ